MPARLWSKPPGMFRPRLELVLAVELALAAE
jgi:hypothetical protein